MAIFKIEVDAPILIHYFSESYHCDQPPGFRSTDATPPPAPTGNLPGMSLGTELPACPVSSIQPDGTEEPGHLPIHPQVRNSASLLRVCPFDPFSNPGIWGQMMLVPGSQAAQILSFR